MTAHKAQGPFKSLAQESGGPGRTNVGFWGAVISAISIVVVSIVEKNYIGIPGGVEAFIKALEGAGIISLGLMGVGIRYGK